MLMTAVDTYLAVRRTMGFQLNTIEHLLRSFARFAAERGHTYVVAQTAIEWATLAPSNAQRHTRLMSVRQFACFMHAENPHHEIPPDHVFSGRRRQRPLPYIFSQKEIECLIAQARQLGPPGSLRPDTYSTLFGLLAVTGMRPAEVRARQLHDVTPDGLLIRESKFKKSRLLPLHETTWVALAHYLDRRQRVAGHTSHLFVSRRGGALSHRVIAETFHHLLRAAGIPGESGRPQPRLMDLRHTFAVRALEACPDDRYQVGQHMLTLTTYMGHAKVESTYYYLEKTPELMIDIAQGCEAFVYGGQP